MTYGCQATSFPRFSEMCLKTGNVSLLATGALCLDLLNMSISLLSLHLCWSGSFGMGGSAGSPFQSPLSMDILSFSRVSGNYYCFGVLLTWKWAWRVTFNFSNSSAWTCLLLDPETSLYAKAPGPTVGSTDGADENLLLLQEMWVQSLGWEAPLEEEMATHSSILPGIIIPWTEEPGRLQSLGMQRVGHSWVAEHTCKHRVPQATLQINSLGLNRPLVRVCWGGGLCYTKFLNPNSCLWIILFSIHQPSAWRGTFTY